MTTEPELVLGEVDEELAQEWPGLRLASVRFPAVPGPSPRELRDRLRASFPDVGFAAVAIRGDRDDLRETIRRRGWGLPVAHDEDGGVANAYAVAVCPTLTFAFRGGRVQGTSLSTLTGAALRERVERLRRGP